MSIPPGINFRSECNILAVMQALWQRYKKKRGDVFASPLLPPIVMQFSRFFSYQGVIDRLPRRHRFPVGPGGVERHFV